MISVVVPARDAASTLRESLLSLGAQTHEDFEAIVVDNGSSDGTARIVTELAATDPRFRLEREERPGVSRARNHGIDLAAGEWVLFLDADDTLEPEVLEVLAEAAAASPDAGVVQCGWLRLAPDGTELERRPPVRHPAPFELLAVTCPYAIHSCLARRELLVEHGGFEEELDVTEDWDLWQRLARAGAEFAPARDGVYAIYRMRADSASGRARPLLAAASAVIERGHGADPRVRSPCAEYERGLHPSGVAAAVQTVGAYAAGFALGRGEEVVELLELLPRGGSASSLAPESVAACVTIAALASAGVGHAGAGALLERIRPPLDAFLSELERISGTAELRRRSLRRIEADLARLSTRPLGRLGELTHAIVDVEAPLEPLEPGRGIERVSVGVRDRTGPLGSVELAACGGPISPAVLRDAIAARFAWPILGSFLEARVYPSLRAAADPSDPRLRTLGLAAGGQVALEHDDVGWTVMLQELFARPELTGDGFYSAATEWPEAPGAGAAGEPVFELLDGPPAPASLDPARPLAVALAGAALGRVHLPAASGEGQPAAGAIVAAALLGLGMELARAMVREALVGRPWQGSLRAALVAARQERAGRSSSLGPSIARRHATRFGAGSSRFGQIPNRGRLRRLARRSGDQVRGLPLARGALAYRPDQLPRLGRRREPGPERPNIGERADGGPAEAESETVAILMYHRVSPDYDERGRRWCVTPDELRRQVEHLVAAGYRTIEPELWNEHRELRKPFASPAVVLTFDDGYADFAAHAWPILREHGFGAVVALPTRMAGATNAWDAGTIEQVDLLDWDEIGRLEAEGVRFASHSASHRPLTSLPVAAAAEELLASRAALAERLEHPLPVIVYPYGDVDEGVQRLAGACGYELGLGCREGRAGFDEEPLALPRIEVRGGRPLARFVAALAE